jgi:hypothetical protein
VAAAFAAQKRSTASITSSFCSGTGSALGIIASEDDCIFAAAETSKYSLANFHPSIYPAALQNCSFSTEADFLRFFFTALGNCFFRLSSPRRWKKYARLIGRWVGCYR